MGWQYRRQHEINKILGIPNHPPCDLCGKIDGGFMGSTAIGDRKVCSRKCLKRMKMRINNRLEPFYKVDKTESVLRDRIRHLKHQLKSRGIKPRKTKNSRV